MLKSKFGSLIILATCLFVLSSCRAMPELADNPQISGELTPSVAPSGHEENFKKPTQIPEDAEITEEPVEFNEWCFDEISKKLIQSHVLAALIPSGFHPFYARSGDLNKDGITDIALVVSSESTLTRPLLIILGDESGGYTLAKRNDSVILDKESGGIHGDPFNSIIIDDGILHICIFGGSSWRWEDNIVFEYSNHESDWFLQKKYHFYYHFEPRIVKSSYLDDTIFGKTSFEDYDGKVDCVVNKSILLGETPNKDFEYYLVSLPNKKIEKKINNQIENYLNQFIAGCQKYGASPIGHTNLQMISNDLLSLEFFVDSNMYFTLNFDLKTGHMLRFRDMINVEAAVNNNPDYLSDVVFPDKKTPSLREMLNLADNPDLIGEPKQIFTCISDEAIVISCPTAKGSDVWTMYDPKSLLTKQYDLRYKGDNAKEIVETFRSYSNTEINYEYMLLSIPNKNIQNKVNGQIHKMVKEELNNIKHKGQFDYYFANVEFITPKIISLHFGGNNVTFDLQTGSRIRLQDIVNINKLAKMFWKVAQNASEKRYYTRIKEDIVLPEYTAAQLKIAFLDSDGTDKNTYSDFYYDGIGIIIDGDFSAFISYKDLKPMLKKDYWREYIPKNGFVPTVHEEG